MLLFVNNFLPLRSGAMEMFLVFAFALFSGFNFSGSRCVIAFAHTSLSLVVLYLSNYNCYYLVDECEEKRVDSRRKICKKKGTNIFHEIDK